MLNLLPRDSWQYSAADLIRALLSGARTETEAEILRLPEVGDCIPVRSGRSGIVAALRALGLPSGARVGVPLFCCAVVFDAIAAAGCVPVFLDIDPKTYCVSPDTLAEKTAEIQALVAVHMFGNVCEVPRLASTAPGIPIIEDCAQAIGSKRGKSAAGTLGTVSVFSFRSGKYLSVGEGGAVFSKDPEIRSRISRHIAEAGQAGISAEWKHACATYLKSRLRSKPLYGLFGYWLWANANQRKGMEARPRIAPCRIYRSDLCLTLRRLPALHGMIARQRANSDAMEEAIGADLATICHEPEGSFYNRLQFPLALPSQCERDELSSLLLGKGIDSVKYLDDIVSVARARHGYQAGCPVSESLSKRVLVLPNYASLGIPAARRIGKTVSWAIGEMRRTHSFAVASPQPAVPSIQA